MSISRLQLRVKERDEVDRCRHCGRPTWSFRRCCVPCKRAGRSGAGSIPSLYSARSAGFRLLAFGCFWTAHVAAAVVFGLILLLGTGERIQAGNVGEMFLLGLVESTLDGIGFALAIVLSPRPAAHLRPRYLLLAAFTGVVCTVLTTAVLVGVGSAGAVPPELVFVTLVVVTAAIGRVCLSASFATRLLEAAADRTPCAECGIVPNEPDETHCRACGEPRQP